MKLQDYAQSMCVTAGAEQTRALMWLTFIEPGRNWLDHEGKRKPFLASEHESV